MDVRQEGEEGISEVRNTATTKRSVLQRVTEYRKWKREIAREEIGTGEGVLTWHSE